MKEILIRINRAERQKALAFHDEVNECVDTVAFFKEGYTDDTLIIAAVGQLAMEYTERKVECTFEDYSITTIK